MGTKYSSLNSSALAVVNSLQGASGGGNTEFKLDEYGKFFPFFPSLPLPPPSQLPLTPIFILPLSTDSRIVFSSVRHSDQRIGIVENGDAKKPAKTGTGIHGQFQPKVIVEVNI